MSSPWVTRAQRSELPLTATSPVVTQDHRCIAGFLDFCVTCERDMEDDDDLVSNAVELCYSPAKRTGAPCVRNAGHMGGHRDGCRA